MYNVLACSRPLTFGYLKSHYCRREEHNNQREENDNTLMEGAGRLKRVEHGRRERIISVFVCPLTLDVETHFPLDNTFGIPDSVATLVCARHGTEADVVLIDTDATLVALPGHPCTGQQYQSWSAGGKVKDAPDNSETVPQSMYITVGECQLNVN